MSDETERATSVANETVQTLAQRLQSRNFERVDAPDLGEDVRVVEAPMGEVVPFLAEASGDRAGFVRRMVSACVRIDGERLSPEMFDAMGMSKWKSLERLFPTILRINGLGDAVNPDAAKNA